MAHIRRTNNRSTLPAKIYLHNCTRWPKWMLLYSRICHTVRATLRDSRSLVFIWRLTGLDWLGPHKALKRWKISLFLYVAWEPGKISVHIFVNVTWATVSLPSYFGFNAGGHAAMHQESRICDQNPTNKRREKEKRKGTRFRYFVR